MAIGDGVHDVYDVGAGDQVMLCLLNESEDALPLTHSMATCLGKT